MTLHESTSLIRAAGGDVWNITTEQGASVIYAIIGGKNCRIIVPRAGQSPPKSAAAVGFLTHVASNATELKCWLSTISDTSNRPTEPLSYAP